MTLTNYPFLQQLLNKHKLATQNNSIDVRFTRQELNNIVLDLISLVASTEKKQEDNTELKNLLKELLSELKQLNSEETDGGKF